MASEKPPISGQRSIICTDRPTSTISAGPIQITAASATVS
jgi:hypothetical protein